MTTETIKDARDVSDRLVSTQSVPHILVCGEAKNYRKELNLRARKYWI
ncbi:hypothetical protein [Paraburkholderia phenazinium]|nr:hypothetical protein [Paraburkholderia phenazinium]